MLHRCNEKVYHFPPYWKDALIAGICTIVLFILMIGNVTADYPVMDNGFLFAICVLCLCLEIRSYALYPDCFMVRLLGISVRKIAWENVTQVVFLQEWKYGSRFFHRDIFLVTTKPCPPVYTVGKNLLSLRLRHPFSVLIVKIPKGKHEKYLSAMKNYIPISRCDKESQS